MGEGSAARLRPADIDMLLESLSRILEVCISEDIECVDPPLATSRFLQNLGYNTYTIRRLWSKIGEGISITLYKSKRSVFSLVVVQQKGAAYHDEYTGVPLDELDCWRLRRRCTTTSNANKLYAFFTGGVEDNRIKINIVRLLSLVEKSTGKAFELIGAARRVLWGEESGEALLGLVKSIVDSYAHMIVLVDPEIVFRDYRLLVESSPILRRLLGRR